MKKHGKESNLFVNLNNDVSTPIHLRNEMETFSGLPSIPEFFNKNENERLEMDEKFKDMNITEEPTEEGI